MRETRIPACPCPRCGQILDAASDMQGDARPRPGDGTVCVYCAALLTFTDDLRLVALTAADVRDLAATDPDVLAQLRRYAAKVRQVGPLGRKRTRTRK